MSSDSGPKTAPAARPNAFHTIGGGRCGAVFHIEGSSKIVKVAKDTDSLAIRREFSTQMATHQLLKHYQVGNVEIPHPAAYFPTGCMEHAQFHAIWPQLANAIKREGLPSNAQFLLAERILSLREPIREALIRRFCPEKFRASTRTSPLNKDCLVRVYLGSATRRDEDRESFSLRDFPLHLNELGEAGMGVENIARGMGRAMAVMHWAVRYDGGGVKFVFGSKKVPHKLPDIDKYDSDPEVDSYIGPNVPFKAVDDLNAHETRLFLIDFDQAKPISMDEDGVRQAVAAIKENGLYFPKACRKTKRECDVWKAFEGSYVVKSWEIINKERLGINVQRLPLLVMRGLIDWAECEAAARGEA